MGKSLQLRIFTVILIMAAILALSGCTTKTIDPIIGTWQADDIPGMDITFTDKNSTLYTNGTAQLSWNGTTLYGTWKSLGNDSYTATFAWSDPKHQDHSLQAILNAYIKYDHGVLYTNIGGLSTFHRKGLGLKMPGSH